MEMSYAELHCISNFTFLRGASHPAELVARAKELGYSALALTDECSLAGVVRAHAAARDGGPALIVGSEFTLTDGLRFVALATSRQGYGALSRFITRGRRAAEKGSYRLGRADLEPGLDDSLALWLPGAAPRAEEALWLRERFAGRLWLAVELPASGADRERLATLCALARELGIPAVASGDVHMHQRRRRALQDTLTAVRLKTTVARAGHALLSRMASGRSDRLPGSPSCTRANCWTPRSRSPRAAASRSTRSVTSTRRKSCRRAPLPAADRARVRTGREHHARRRPGECW